MNHKAKESGTIQVKAKGRGQKISKIEETRNYSYFSGHLLYSFFLCVYLIIVSCYGIKFIQI